MDEERVISEFDFEQVYKPCNPIDFNEIEPYLKTHGKTDNHVWTIIDSDEDDTLFAAAGYHTVNRLNYVITEIPWVSGNELAEW